MSSRDNGDVVFVGDAPPDTYESLRVGACIIPCEVYLVSVKVVDKWVDVKTYTLIYQQTKH